LSRVSVGGFDALADAVAEHVDALGAALSAGSVNLAAAVQPIATALASLAAGAAPPPRGGRAAFWK
jgi:hypothetical protein